jgi:hypothetical protein
MFSEDSDVIVKQLDEPPWKFWEVRHSLHYRAKIDVFRVGPPFRTDFASVPRVFVWFLPRYERHTRGAILHDYLWQRANADQLPWRDADAIFRRAMRNLGVPFLRRWIMWTAVRWVALLRKRNLGGGTAWLADAPHVLFFTIVALPIVVFPAILIALALILFSFWEAFAWLVLAFGRWVKHLRRQSTPKELNRPTFEWKLG